jgi:hypothetical protein
MAAKRVSAPRQATVRCRVRAHLRPVFLQRSQLVDRRAPRLTTLRRGDSAAAPLVARAPAAAAAHLLRAAGTARYSAFFVTGDGKPTQLPAKRSHSAQPSRRRGSRTARTLHRAATMRQRLPQPWLLRGCHGAARRAGAAR